MKKFVAVVMIVTALAAGAAATSAQVAAFNEPDPSGAPSIIVIG